MQSHFTFCLFNLHFSDDDATMIKKIVQYIDEELSSRMPIDYGNVVGMGPHEKKLLPLLNIDSEKDVRVIGIWGMGGIGKTTIVDYLFNRYSRRFPARCLMRNVSKDSKYRNLLYLQKEFISKTLPIRKCKFEHSTVEEGRQVIESRFGHQRVFVILDGVDAINQIQAVAKKTSMFGPGSRIIITARDRKLLKNYGIREDDLYELWAHASLERPRFLSGKLN
ncbi:Disease resistance protein Roq1 [Cardamine amara subsp. amara]|uniref:Disease resistance protein Roq1 n=1 Tax=Cardamine amara subsp. amara TaxID=228776 RepID=A0ABD0ZMU0_CARAN